MAIEPLTIKIPKEKIEDLDYVALVGYSLEKKQQLVKNL
mgnify:CR=1 FL=1